MDDRVHGVLYEMPVNRQGPECAWDAPASSRLKLPQDIRPSCSFIGESQHQAQLRP